VTEHADLRSRWSADGAGRHTNCGLKGTIRMTSGPREQAHSSAADRVRSCRSARFAFRLLLDVAAEEGSLDGGRPETEKTAAFGASSEAMDCAWWDEHEGAGSDSFCRVGVGVEGVRTF